MSKENSITVINLSFFITTNTISLVSNKATFVEKYSRIYKYVYLKNLFSKWQ